MLCRRPVKCSFPPFNVNSFRIKQPIVFWITSTTWDRQLYFIVNCAPSFQAEHSSTMDENLDLAGLKRKEKELLKKLGEVKAKHEVACRAAVKRWDADSKTKTQRTPKDRQKPKGGNGAIRQKERWVRALANYAPGERIEVSVVFEIGNLLLLGSSYYVVDSMASTTASIDAGL